MSYIKVVGRPISRTLVHSFAGGVNTRNDESVLPISTAKNCYNFKFESGALTSGKGFLSAGLSAECVWQFCLRVAAQNKVITMYYLAGKVYYIEDGEGKELQGITLTSPPQAVNYTLYGKDVVLICSPTDNMVVWDGENDAYFVENSPKITSMTMHYERLFATTSTDKYTLYFSDDLDPTNWNENITEGGFIQMLDERGELLKVISFLGYVYVFREHGISRVTAYADQTQFAVTHLFTASGKIFADTVALCGDKVMFACEDGIYVFDGLSARKVLSNLDGFIKSDSHSTAIFYEGKYYLSLRVDYDGKVGCENGEYLNNVVLIYGDGYEIVRGYDIRKFCAGDELYAISGTSVLKIGTNGLQKCWESPVVDLGSSKRKRVLWLYLDTCCDVTVTFFGDGIQKSVTVSGSATAQRVRVDMTCRKFGLRIVSIDDAPKVSRPQIYYRYTE